MQIKNLKLMIVIYLLQVLDAIFKTSIKGISPSLTARDFSVISNYLTQASQNIDNIPDWGANEYILINSKELYIPRVIEAFQNWSKDNQQKKISCTFIALTLIIICYDLPLKS